MRRQRSWRFYGFINSIPLPVLLDGKRRPIVALSDLPLVVMLTLLQKHCPRGLLYMLKLKQLVRLGIPEREGPRQKLRLQYLYKSNRGRAI